ncbi:hypothetical protein ACF0H5_009250 [Mactra antiquata]
MDSILWHHIHGVCGPDWNIVGANYCYRISNVGMSWYDAHTECRKMDSMLVRLNDPGVIVSNNKNKRYWPI